MPKKKSPGQVLDPTLELKTLALRDDPLVYDYMKIHYKLFSAGPPLAKPLSEVMWRLMRDHARLNRGICKKYQITAFHGDNPQSVPEEHWLTTLRASNTFLRIKTNWRSSLFSPPVLPKKAISKNSVNSFAMRLLEVPPLPDKPTKSSPPVMTMELDLSQVKRNSLADLAEEFKQAVRRCLDELPKPLRKPPTTWQQNVERDYRRFRQHFYQGVPYRWIAAYELKGAMSRRPIGVSVPTESSVRESVERVHLILFRKEYKLFRESFKARRHVSHRADTRLAHKIKTFNCHEHGPDCGPSLSCPYAKAFNSDIKDLR